MDSNGQMEVARTLPDRETVTAGAHDAEHDFPRLEWGPWTQRSSETGNCPWQRNQRGYPSPATLLLGVARSPRVRVSVIQQIIPSHVPASGSEFNTGNVCGILSCIRYYHRYVGERPSCQTDLCHAVEPDPALLTRHWINGSCLHRK